MNKLEASQAAEAARREQQDEEARGLVESFVALMKAKGVGALALYSRTAHPITQEVGFVRRRQVNTGQVRHTYQPVGRGWPIGASDGNDRDPHIITVADDQRVFRTSYPVRVPAPDAPAAPHLIVYGDDVGTGCFALPSFADALAYAALEYANGTRQP